MSRYGCPSSLSRHYRSDRKPSSRFSDFTLCRDQSNSRNCSYGEARQLYIFLIEKEGPGCTSELHSFRKCLITGLVPHLPTSYNSAWEEPPCPWERIKGYYDQPMACAERFPQYFPEFLETYLTSIHLVSGTGSLASKRSSIRDWVRCHQNGGNPSANH